MDSVQTAMLGCGLMLAGLAADHCDTLRWRIAGRQTAIDALTVLSFVLPFAGLIVIVATAA